MLEKYNKMTFLLSTQLKKVMDKLFGVPYYPGIVIIDKSKKYSVAFIDSIQKEWSVFSGGFWSVFGSYQVLQSIPNRHPEDDYWYNLIFIENCEDDSVRIISQFTIGLEMMKMETENPNHCPTYKDVTHFGKEDVETSSLTENI